MVIPSPVVNLKPTIPQSLQLSLPNNPRTTADFSPSSSWLQDGQVNPKWRSTNASSPVSGHKTTLVWDQKPSPKWRGRAQEHLMLPHADKWPPNWGFPWKKGRKRFNLWPSGCSTQRTRRWGLTSRGNHGGLRSAPTGGGRCTGGLLQVGMSKPQKSGVIPQKDAVINFPSRSCPGRSWDVSAR